MNGIVLTVLLALFWLTIGASDASALTVTPNTWNIVGLDSNSPAFGPNRFPVGAKVCGGTPGATDTAAFTWDAGGTTNNDTYIYLRAGSANPVSITFGADGCADAYFEAEVAQNTAAYGQSRRYHITAGGISTPTPRELYVEHLISQARNAITDISLDGVSVPAGGSMNLVVGMTYTIQLSGGTATQGYNQFAAFINFSNKIFQLLSVSTDYNANNSPYVTSPNPGLYADACLWENNPMLPTYRSCVGGDYKTGGAPVVTTYVVKILSSTYNGTSQSLSTLLYDFSGASFHYNSDYSTGARIANIIDPNGVTIAKSFSPNQTNPNLATDLIILLTNPNPVLSSGLTFTDVFPTAPGAMTLASTSYTNTCGGSVTNSAGGALAVGSAGIKLTNGTIPANSSCTITVSVTAPSTGSYTNTTGHLLVNGSDTGSVATATLTVDNSPPAGTGLCGMTLAQWTFPTGFSTTAPAPSTATVAAAASPGAGITPSSNTASATADGTACWISNGAMATGATLVTTNNDYFEFAVNTTGYTSAYLTFSAERKINNSPNGVAVYTGTAQGNPETGTQLYSNSTVLAANTTWYAFGAGNSLPLTAVTGTTYARIYGFNSGNTNPGSDLYIDNVTITGCGTAVKPTIAKSFSPGTVAVGVVSQLTFTLTNTNTSALTGATFADVFPTTPGLMTLASTTTSNTCGGSLTNNVGGALAVGSAGIKLTNGTIPGSGSCTVSVDVTVNAAGTYSNASGYLTTTEGGQNTASTATASLTAVLPPSISKQFAPNPIQEGGSPSTLTFTITNPNQGSSLNGVAFSDSFPSGMIISSPSGTSTSCGGIISTPTGSSLSFSNGTIGAAVTCAVTVKVTAPAGLYTNTTGTVSATTAGSGNTATDTLNVSAVQPELTLLKQVASSPTGTWYDYLAVSSGSNVYFQFTVENDGDVPLSSVSVVDDLVSTAGCAWHDGDGVLISGSTFTLPVAVAANNQHYATCVVGPITALPGYHESTATADGTYNSIRYSDEDWAIYATTGLSLAKRSAQSVFTKTGDVLNYSYEVMNINAASLLGPVTVTDNKTTVTCPLVTTVGNSDNYLDPYSTTGEKLICQSTYTVQAADVTAKTITNTASADMDGVTSASVSLTIMLAPDLSAAKTNDVAGLVTVGSSFTWTLTVSNAVSAGTATVANGQVLLTDDLPVSGATYAAPAAATNAGGTTGAIRCAITASTLNCTANGSVTIPPGGSFSEVVTVTTTTTGSLANPKGGGVCTADQADVFPEIDETNNGCADTVTVQALPSLLLVKSVQVYSDPFSGTIGPKAVPGAFMLYTIQASNQGAGPTDSNTVVVRDSIPPSTAFYVGDIGGPGPVLFSNGAPSSTLTYSYTGLADLADSLAFSSDHGVSWNYVPVADGNGCDSNITDIRISLGGAFASSASAPRPSFTLQFRVGVQ